MPPGGTSSGTASLSDIFSSAKNLVTAVAALTQAYLNVEGVQNDSAISVATVVKGEAGRICRISVTTAGTSTGMVYDATLTTSTGRPIYVIPEAVGIYDVNLPTNYGIVITPGTGQVLTVSFS